VQAKEGEASAVVARKRAWVRAAWRQRGRRRRRSTAAAARTPFPLPPKPLVDASAASHSATLVISFTAPPILCEEE
jgi:hypothetical protein